MVSPLNAGVSGIENVGMVCFARLNMLAGHIGGSNSANGGKSHLSKNRIMTTQICAFQSISKHVSRLQIAPDIRRCLRQFAPIPVARWGQC